MEASTFRNAKLVMPIRNASACIVEVQVKEALTKHHMVEGTPSLQTENRFTVTVQVSKACNGDNQADDGLAVTAKAVEGTADV